MKVRVKDFIEFRAENGVDSRCMYMIVDNTKLGTVVFMIQSPENTGSSVTNSAEVIASVLHQKFDLPVNQLFFEVYPPQHALDLAGWEVDRVDFPMYYQGNYQGPPHWSPLRSPENAIGEYLRQVVSGYYDG